jgi:hypothetical protein
MSSKSTERSSEDKSENSNKMNESCETTEKDKKGKQPLHGKPIPKKSSSSSKEKGSSSFPKETALTESENVVLKAISALQSSINKQSERMSSHEKQISEQNKQLKEFAARMSYFEGYDHEDENLDYYDECDNYDVLCPPPVLCPQGGPSHSGVNDELGDDVPVQNSSKRKAETDDNNNRFNAMSKRFKAAEICDQEIDSVLASNINELFRNGIEETKYNEIIKDEVTPRPSNCEGLVVVQTNPLIWDSLSAVARSNDKKMQNIEASVVKSATKIAKVVDKMAKLETNGDGDVFSSLIDECNDVLALLGQANKQINFTRKDFLRPELNKEYSHLCNHNRPVTKYLFGDDVSKSAKEIEDCSKISNRMFQNRYQRGAYTGRRRPSRFNRGRFGSGRGMTRGRGQVPSYGEPVLGAKNFPRRGSRPYRQ